MGETVTKYVAVFVEFGCAFLVLIGFMTRWASLLLCVLMAVAFFVVHKTDAFNVRELALMYLVASVAIFLMGPGKYSIDNGMKD
jgi:putative oxidoreductase